jgi:putative flippase GtrA
MADPFTQQGSTGLIRATWGRREIRFLVVGGLNTLLALALFASSHLVLGPDVPYLALLVPTYGIGIPVAFATQRIFVFDAHGGSVVVDFARYTLVQLFSVVLNAGLLALFVEVISAPLLLAQVITLALIVVVTYFGHLLFSFRRR